LCLAPPSKFRLATLADAPDISRLVNDTFRSERFFIDRDRTDPGKVSGLLEKGKFLLWFDEAALIGCVYVELRGERGYFGLLSVDPKHQRSGMGGRLIQEAEQLCRTAGCRFMDLTIVNVRRELPGYYQRFGYVENGTLPFPEDQIAKIPVHLVRMSKEL
jgi:predicted N-acetyltransferase YhbS